MDPIQKQLEDLQKELAGHFEKAAAETTIHGKALDETVATMKKLQSQVDEIDVKIAAKLANTPATGKSLIDHLKESDDVSRILRDKKGHAIINLKGSQIADMLERKTTVTLGGLGDVTPGVVNIERMPGIVPEARRILHMRQVLTARPTQAGLIYYVKVTQPPTAVSPVAETITKPEAAVAFSTAIATVKTIATWIPASKQALDDFDELEGFLTSSLPYYVNREEDRQILSGDNTGENLNGLITQASAFNTALLTGSGNTDIDQIGAAIEQIELIDEIEPTFVALNPLDWWKMRRTKDTLGRYILGDPQTTGNPTIWDLTTVPTTGVVAGTFLVGSGQSAASEIRDRMEMTVEISTEHADYFTRNLVAIRAEKRMALVVLRPGSFISGTFSS